jgi:hypothetical protein
MLPADTVAGTGIGTPVLDSAGPGAIAGLPELSGDAMAEVVARSGL